MIVVERFEFVKKFGDIFKFALSFLSMWFLSLFRLLDRIELVICMIFFVIVICRLFGFVWMISLYIILNDRRRMNMILFFVILYYVELFYRFMDCDILYINN